MKIKDLEKKTEKIKISVHVKNKKYMEKEVSIYTDHTTNLRNIAEILTSCDIPQKERDRVNKEFNNTIKEIHADVKKFFKNIGVSYTNIQEATEILAHLDISDKADLWDIYSLLCFCIRDIKQNEWTMRNILQLADETEALAKFINGLYLKSLKGLK